MKWSIRLAFVALFFGIQPTTAEPGNESPHGKQLLQFNLRVLEGDPLGSQEAGTIQVVAEPRLATFVNHSFSFSSGDQVVVSQGQEGVRPVQCGLRIEGKPGAIKDGKVPLDVTLSNTRLKDGNEQRKEFQSESTRTITTIRLGEVIKLRWPADKADKQVWAELSVLEVKP